MKAALVGELGMEGHGKDVPLPHRHRMTVHLGEHLHVLAVAFHPELTEERRLHRWLLDRAGVAA